MRNLSIPNYPPVYRDPHPDCAPGCEYPLWRDPVHPVYCHEAVGRGLLAHQLTGATLAARELEFGVSVASATRTEALPEADRVVCRATRHHRNVIQLQTVLDHDSGSLLLTVDFSRGEARSLAATLTRAADIADGLVAS